MTFAFQRELTIPLWAIGFLAIALAAPTPPMPRVIALLTIAAIALMMQAMLRWRTARPLVAVIPGMPVDRAARTAPDDVLDLVRMDDDGGWQMERETAFSGTMDVATTAERQREGGGAPKSAAL